MTSSEVTQAEYYFYAITSLINAFCLTFMLVKYGYLFKINKYAVIVLVCMIIWSLQPFWMIEMNFS